MGVSLGSNIHAILRDLGEYKQFSNFVGQGNLEVSWMIIGGKIN